MSEELERRIHPDQQQVQDVDWYLRCHRALHAPWVALSIATDTMHLEKYLIWGMKDWQLDALQVSRSVSYIRSYLSIVLYAYGIRMSAVPNYIEPNEISRAIKKFPQSKANTLAEALLEKSGYFLHCLNRGYTWMPSSGGINYAHLHFAAQSLFDVLYLIELHYGYHYEHWFHYGPNGEEIHNPRTIYPPHMAVSIDTHEEFNTDSFPEEVVQQFSIDRIEGNHSDKRLLWRSQQLWKDYQDAIKPPHYPDYDDDEGETL